MDLKNKKLLITGGAGFFGELLKQALLNNDFDCISVDLENDDFLHLQIVSGVCQVPQI